MKKPLKLLTVGLGAMLSFGIAVNAEGITDESTLRTCLESNDTKTCTLSESFNTSGVINVHGTKILDLAGKKITASNKLMIIEDGRLEITGTGTITNTNEIPIRLYGSQDSNASNYSVLTIGSGVTIESENSYAILINKSGSKEAAYGTALNVNGATINGYYAPIYVNGTAKNTTNSIKISIGDNTTLSGNGIGIYAAGYAEWQIGKANINTMDTGIVVKAGKFVFNGTTIKASGEDDRPTPGNNNGANTSGSTIQIESSNSYAGNIDITINSGKYESLDSVVIYEYLSSTSNPAITNTRVESIKINGGEFISATNKPIFDTSSEFNSAISKFITGGTYNNSIDEKYIAEKYVINKTNGNFTVKENKVIETTDNKVTFESKEALGNDYKLVVTEEEVKEEVSNKAEKAIEEIINNDKTIAKDITVLTVYDISVKDSTNQIVEMENGQYTIKLVLDESLLKYDKYKVVYINDEGEIEETLDATLDGEEIKFNTTHLSKYAVIGYNVESTTKNPVTSDINIKAYIILTVVSAICSIYILRKAKNN